MIHFKALYSYEPPQLTIELIAQTKLKAMDVVIWERQLMDKVLRDNLTKSQVRMKVYANTKRKEGLFDVAYKLQLPSGSKIHHVFHLSN